MSEFIKFEESLAGSDNLRTKLSTRRVCRSRTLFFVGYPPEEEPDQETEAGSVSISKDDVEDNSSSRQNETQYPRGATLAFIVIALILSIFLPSLDMTIVATAIPKITDEFHGLDKVSWYGSAFFMTNGGFQSSWGKAYKYFPLKMTFLLSILVLELGSLICAGAPNSTTLIASRAISGLGAAGIGTGAYTIIAFVAEPRERAMFTGIIGVSYGFASDAGPLIGGVFPAKVSWRWCFYINLPIGGVSALIILLLFHAPYSAKPVPASWKEKLLQMDIVGIAMIMGAVVTYILALQYGGQSKAWNSAQVIGLLVAFVVILIVFCVWERFQGERAMVIPRLFKQRTVALAISIGGAGAAFITSLFSDWKGLNKKAMQDANGAV
ncbi:Major Facilitator Superfamily protein [Coccidioides posadasii C735 delta SOWgp]|uniref:Major Facilitator Superfamily protein n=1 Tax=Coccidioides posadasii (strain C735) TaxID=222929 RepID=C5PHJ5_COCP7|nr:Major Facilitator Superfamily protein [Coccidioides posadasii C735 delta SOWgp]EER23998.1 Major Facilitator Superfamily protein [Coccidioides posadasii C735 delta SOWgp]|eukprot:XP_003066143.1 Major Facilitator Superfamily protein [Coccidioides posadasii C735 delta SOWgp]